MSGVSTAPSPKGGANVRFPPIADIRLARHSRVMRIGVASIALLLAASCNNGHHDSPAPTGWQYRPAQGAVEASLSYVDDKREIRLFGSCNGEPVFFLKGGDYPAGATKFTLTVDDQSWVLPAWQGEHGRGLWVNRPEQQAAIGRAKRRIVFQVGDWRREITPSSELASFTRACS